ncbi:hypothetical protein GTR00_18340 [Kineococcus sp. T90]|nr:hypothetical protein [Kineococcus indalonis]
MFVAHREVGLLHRLRRAARASTALVLVRLDPGAALPLDAQVGVGVQVGGGAPARLLCLGGLGARDATALLAWLAGPASGLRCAPAALHHRVVVPPAGPAVQRRP